MGHHNIDCMAVSYIPSNRLPTSQNVARFDAFDSGGPDSTRIIFRALHDLPAGTELAQSYVPLHWSVCDSGQMLCAATLGAHGSH
jgi:hypothetical protein